ncbi:hypothetical protein ACFL1C_05320 [Pseudomonadota bacterium]
MMAGDRDKLLQAAFAEARQNLDDDVFTARVMTRSRNLLYLLTGGAISLALVILAGVWLTIGIPLLEFAVLISQVFTTALVDLGEGWLALVFMPVNNIASLFVLSGKAILMAWKKLISASFSN